VITIRDEEAALTNKKIFVVVDGGTATVRGDTVPDGIIVEVIDLDLIQAGESFPSPEAFQYCVENEIVAYKRKRKPQAELAVT